MSHDFILLDDAAAESQLQDVPQEWSLPRQYSLFPRFLGFSHSRPRGLSYPRAGDSEKSPWSRRLYANLKAFFSRFLELAYNPESFGPVITDCLLLIQSTWSGRQLGPDLVYPMMGIRKRHSGHLARLILDHSRDQQGYEVYTQRKFPQGIDPPCVAVIEVPKATVENDYSARMDLHGLACLLMLMETFFTLVQSLFYLDSVNSAGSWMFTILISLVVFGYSVLRGDGTLTLALRPDTSTSGCAVLLDQDFTVFLNGDQSVVEAIAERSFNLSYSSRLIWGGHLRVGNKHHHSYRLEDSSSESFGALCEGASFAVFLLWLLAILEPDTGIWVARTSLWTLFIIFPVSLLVSRSRSYFDLDQLWRAVRLFGCRSLLVALIGLAYLEDRLKSIIDISTAINWHLGTASLYLFLLGLASAKSNATNYPIRRGKLLDAIRHPLIRKWQFDTLAAATTFQCLVLCHGIARPIKSVDVLAFLEMLIPDEREVWKVWKKRVADRIVHEEDISLTPTIPMFRDKMEQDMLVDLLGEAKKGYDTYRHFFGPDALLDCPVADDVPPTYFARIWSAIKRLFSC